MRDLIERLRGYRFPIDPKRQMITVLDCKKAADRIEALEAALRNIAAAHAEGGQCSELTMVEIARAALAPEPDK